MKTKDKRQYRAFLLYEVLVAICVLTIMITVKARISVSSKNASVRLYSRQMCNAAALAQLDCISCTGAELTAQQVGQLWQGVKVNTAREPGADCWQGLEKLAVTAERQLAEGDIVACTQFRYIVMDIPVSENVEEDVNDVE